MSFLELRDVTRRFGGLVAVDRVAFSVEEGEILGLMGANGAGKTTLFAMIAGTIAPSDGSILLAGRAIEGLSAAEINRLGIARSFQIVRPFAEMSVLENVTAACLYGRARLRRIGEAEQRAGGILERMGLSGLAGKSAGSLTLAQRKRLEIARALGTAPRILLLDEVMAGLTATEVEDALALIAALRREDGLTLIVIEHVMQALMRLSDRIVVLHNGAKLAEGRPEVIARDTKVLEVYLGGADPDA